MSNRRSKRKLLSRVAIDTLRHLEREGSMTAVELARVLGLPRRTAHWRVAEYLDKGLIRPAGEQKSTTRPATLYTLSARGAKALAACQ